MISTTAPSSHHSQFEIHQTTIKEQDLSNQSKHVHIRGWLPAVGGFHFSSTL